MKGLTKFKKLLCFLIVSIFVFGFGGEIAKAETNSFTTKGSLNFLGQSSADEFQWKYNSTQNVEAFCIDSSSASPTKQVGTYKDLEIAPNITDIVPADKVDSVIAIIKASENLNLDADKKYYVTQAFIWYTVYGTYNTGHANGISTALYNRITTTSPYKEAWNQLQDSVSRMLEGEGNSNQFNQYPKMQFDVSHNKMSVSGDYLYSENIFINIAGTVSVDNSAVPSEGACIYYNNECTNSATIPANTAFKVRVNKPAEGSGQVQIAIRATSSETFYKYYLQGFYHGWDLVRNRKIQDMVILKNESKNVFETKKFVGNYENEDATDVEIQKTDIDTGLKVSGAKLKITDENGVTIGVFTSTAEGEANPRVHLPIGSYYLSEDSQPDGYYYNAERIAFSVVREGSSAIVKDANGNTLTIPTISFSNKAIKIKFRKLVDKVTYDSEGNMTVEKVPMAGVKFKIVSYAYASVDGENAELCAISDANGYLTQPCSGDEDTHNVNSNGEYRLGIDFGKASDIYQIREYCLTDGCKPFVKDSTTGETYGISSNAGARFQVFNGGRNIVLANNVLSTSYSEGSTPVITINITNQYHIDISKTAITGGAEIPGAVITVTDPSLQSGEGDFEPDGIVDKWTSTTEPHTIIGVVPGVKYRLTEEVAPKGFVKMVNSIDFIMDEDGKITTYDIQTGEQITDLNGTDYHLLITNAPTKTIFSKTSAVSGEEIEGAKLKVCTKESYDAAKAATGDGNNCESFVIPYSGEKVEWVSEAGKSHIVSALPAGDYYLVETIAPEGYAKQTNSASFVVKTDGSISKVELKNEPTKVVISKKDIATEGEIEGAQLKICTLDDYNNDGANCKPARDDLSWISGTEPKEFDLLPIGDYVLIETIPAPDYQEGMIIDGDLMTAYEFSITEDNYDIKIDVYNQILTHVPSTGLSTLNLFAIGGLMIFAGYETIKIYRRKALN